nr:MAG TPA_asm: hypothetical protein [Caudoviricetes sp.]
MTTYTRSGIIGLKKPIIRFIAKEKKTKCIKERWI